ncbi:MAG: hypothetical protein M3Z10_00950 [Gemmatimonadota bacterium]|nr:hypothetical protein [Gemmatimonadota bacterium]
MRYFITATSLVVQAFAATSYASAQSIPVDSGQPVRVALRVGPLIEGTLVRQTPERLVVRVAAGDTGARTMFLLRDLENVASLTRVHSAGSAFKGLGLGLLGGAIVGGVVAAVAINSCSNKVPHDDMCGLYITAVPAAAALGGVVGLIVGSVRTRMEWRPVWSAPAASP